MVVIHAYVNILFAVASMYVLLSCISCAETEFSLDFKVMK